MGTSPIRVLIVDDNEPVRQFLRSTLQNKLEMQTIVETSDGQEAIELALALQLLGRKVYSPPALAVRSPGNWSYSIDN